MNRKCFKCGSNNILYFPRINAGVKPDSFIGINYSIGEGRNDVEFEAYICKNCGFVEICAPIKKLKKIG